MKAGERAVGQRAARQRVRQLLGQLAQDASALKQEIVGFIRESVRACETGRKPWDQAFASIGGVALLSAAVALAVSHRPVVAGLHGSYWLARAIGLRWLCFVLMFAFSTALFQNKALIGDDGILPARRLLQRADNVVEASLPAEEAEPRMRPLRRWLMRFEKLPTLLWFASDRQKLDSWLRWLALSGLVLAGEAFLRGGATAWNLLVIWVLYHSINAVGQRWYSFGWESQLLETTLLAVMAAPAGLLACGAPGAALPGGAPPPFVAVLAFRWLAFRIMLGAGLIKVRGARCWLDLTAMCHHLETQPIPNPLSRRFHNLPRPAHLYATAANHVIELVIPFLVLVPWRPALVAFGVVHICFQASLILTGNLSFLNWLTIVPAFWFFDDAFLVGLLPSETAERVANAILVAGNVGFHPGGLLGGVGRLLHLSRDAAVIAVIVWLSVPVYKNLLGPRGGARQRMNSAFSKTVTLPEWLVRAQLRGLDAMGGLSRRLATWGRSGGAEAARPQPAIRKRLPAVSFDVQSLRLLNTYGAFGSVNLERIEIVFEGSRDGSTEWLPYTFKAAVDDPMKRPGIVAPYHLRLDWCRWIASCRGRRSQGLEEAWALAFVRLLLSGPSEPIEGLLAKDGNPFSGGPPPAKIRAGLYSYRFAPPPQSAEDPYWVRERVGEYLPPLGLSDLGPL